MSSYPPDWLVRPLGKVYPKIVVGYVGNVNNHYCAEDSGVPFYRTLNIRNGHFRSDECLYVTYSFNDKNKKSQIRNNDIVIARVGANLGMVCKVTGLTSLANMANAIIIKTNEVDTADADFYTAFLLSPMGKNQIFSGAAGGAQGVFNTKLTQEILVPVPSLPEQRKIAKILSTWDKAIATTEKLIAASKQQKKALMQQLLTGKKRLVNPETGRVFEGEWEKKLFKNILKLDRGSSPRPIVDYITEDEDGVNWIKIGDTKGNDLFINSTKQKITKEGAKKSRKVSKGEVIVSNSMSYGKPYILNIDGYIHDGWFVIRNYEKDFDIQFLLQLLASELIQSQYKRLAAGGVVSNISSDLVYAVKVTLPDLIEQQKIARVLAAADQEIEHLESKLAHFQQEKKALMQQLLTGKRRVKVDSEVETV